MNFAESTLLAAVEGGRWRPGIANPTVLGWAMVAAYFLACLVCGLSAWREPMPDGTRRPRGRPSRFWLALSALMLALGINKQLDLQTLVTQVGRDLAKAWGLYQGRRILQSRFIVAVIMVCAGSLAALFWAARRSLRRRWPAIAGMIYILGFVVIRAASFHNVDALLRERLVGMTWNSIFELGGIAIVAGAAIRVLVGPRGRAPRPEGAMTYRYRINTE